MKAVVFIRTWKIGLSEGILATNGVKKVTTLQLGPYDHLAEVEIGGSEVEDMFSITNSIRGIEGVTEIHIGFVSKTHEKQVTVAIGQGSCQLLASLDWVPEVGETITIPEDRVLGAKGVGMGLVGRPIVVTVRGEDIEVEGKMVPHIWARTEGSPTEED